MLRRTLAFLITLFVLGACTAGEESDASEAAQTEMAPKAVVLQLGSDLAPAVRERLEELLKGRAPQLRVIAPDADAEGDADTLVLAIGETTSTRRLIRREERAPEGVIVRQGKLNEAHLIAIDGGAAGGATSNLGAAYAAYAVLESFGFAFLHPLAPTLPKAVRVPATQAERKESPRWPVRGIQLHTMHPLELTDLLEGWGPKGPDDAKGWEAMLPEWSRFLEWMVANRLNRVQWVLLQAKSWSAFSESPTRHARLKRLVDEAHRWGITVGVDAAISMEQQHMFSLIREIGDEASEIAELDRRVDWLMDAGFDYISTESGQSEFHHGDPKRMLAWLEALTKRVEDRHQRHVFVKVHTSTGQTATGFVDPRDGSPLNINFLSHFADRRLGMMPHTVQHYGIDDPALTYGQSSFRPMYDFMAYEAGSRPVLWHPETAYWVSFDVDVPLFLPIYAERRVSDLRKIARDEAAGKYGGANGTPKGARIDGQMIFSSGWEWGYWLNDVVTARASYDPETSAPSDLAATKRILAKALPFGAATNAVVEAIATTATDQAELLIQGKVNGKAPRDLHMRNGQAYLQGFETWDEISEWGRRLGVKGAQMTQPNRLGLIDMHNPLANGPKYAEVAPLLAAMEERFGARSASFEKLRPTIPEVARDLFDDLADASRMTALRARQIHALFDYSDAKTAQRLADARAALDQAAEIVRQREPRYRTPVDRIAGWRNNPTSYEFTYLWTVHSLFYWWRDEGKVTEKPLSPCYANIIDPVDVGVGEGGLQTFASVLRSLLEATVIGGGVAECLTGPKGEPTKMFSKVRR